MAPDPDVHAPPIPPSVTAPAPEADPAAERRRRQIERGVFKRRNVPSGQDRKTCSKPEDEAEAHPS
jgi:hypothetical protein